MAYQFDPAPTGLHYESARMSFTSIPIWFLRDQAPHPWIDLRSIFEVAGAKWLGKWNRHCQKMQGAWGLEACTDRKMRETFLAPADRLSEILEKLELLLERSAQLSQADRMAQVRSQWRARLDLAIQGVPQPLPDRQRKTPTRKTPSKSKITSYVVNQVYGLTHKGHTRAEIAKALRISTGTISLIVSGKYPSLDSDAKLAWERSFGKAMASETV